MRLGLDSVRQEVDQVKRTDALRLVTPVILAGISTALLMVAIDRSQPLSFISSVMGMLLLGVVFLRQVAKIVSLEEQVESRARQLSVVSEVVAALNSSSNVGTTLGPALERIVRALGADAGAIWLPSPEDRKLTLVEQTGLPDPDREGEIMEAVVAATSSADTMPVRHAVGVPGRSRNQVECQCLTVKVGRRAEDLGYLTAMKWSGKFGDPEGSIITAIGSDIGGALRSIRMINEARGMADRDAVTELYNHRYVHQRLYAEVERHGRSDRQLGVLMLDLDNFKLFNDTYGHPAGDEVLKRVSAVLRRCFRDTDVVARYGGDEFMVILPETSLAQSLKCAERLKGMLNKERFGQGDAASVPIQFSCGISSFPDDSREVLELVAIADANLYQSKAHGDGQITARTSNVADSAFLNVEGFDLFRSMVIAVDNKDRYTRRHSEDVTDYSLQIAREIGCDEDFLRTLHISGLLHDVGKIGVPDRILRKPGRLTDEEAAVMRQHPVLGALIVGAIPGTEGIVEGVRYHHERYDGRGYPDGLEGDNIPLMGRIMAVADAYSAMTTSRPYRRGLTEPEALEEITRGLGTQFDPELGAIFVRLRRAQLEEVGKKPTAAAEPAEEQFAVAEA